MTRRAWIVAGALAAVIAAAVGVGLFLLRSPGGGKPDGSSSPTTAREPKVEVEQAYLAYWDAYAEALLQLDSSKLEEVLTDKALDSTRAFVEEQRTKNQPVRVRVAHNYTITVVRADFASVDDTFIDNSVRLDPQTREPVEPEPNASVRNSYTLRKVGGKWKVAEIIGHESGSPSS